MGAQGKLEHQKRRKLFEDFAADVMFYHVCCNIITRILLHF